MSNQSASSQPTSQLTPILVALDPQLIATSQPGAAPPSSFEPQVLTPATQRGLYLLSVALGAGLAGDWLLRNTALGINLFAWLAVTGGATLFVVRHEPYGTKTLYRLALPLGFFAAAFAWRDSATLQALDVLALLVTILLIGFQTQRGRLVVSGILEYALMGFVLACETMAGLLIMVTGDIRWRELPRDGWSRHAMAIAKGLAFALPILLVFAGLLMAADAVFENLMLKTFSFDAEALLSHAIFAGALSWFVGGLLHGLMTESSMSGFVKRKGQAGSRTSVFSLGTIETSIIFGLLNLLFLAFVLVQFRYLFLHGASISLDNGTAFANYARRGFFELVWVSILLLPLLLGMHWLLRKDEPRNELVFRVLAGIQIALLFVIMVSAVQRMLLYHKCCGLTELRIYTLAFQGWLAVVFLWFGGTVLRGQRERFAFGAVVAGLCFIAFLHVLNPDALIARVNLARAHTGQHTDIPYTTSLSADSVPALVEGLAGLSETEKQDVIRALQSRDWSGGGKGWRGWNWSRVRAYKAVIGLPQVSSHNSQAAEARANTVRR